MGVNYFADYNQRFKKVCSKKKCPTSCNSLSYISKLRRWCYDENYNLRSDQNERVRLGKLTTNVMTGIIEFFDKSTRGNDVNNFDIYEKNLTPYSEYLQDNRFSKGIERVADIYKIQSNSLIHSIIKEIKQK